MKHWEYRAIDSRLQILSGTARAPTFIQLSLMLRQKGLQVIEATEIQLDQVLANKRMLAMKRRLHQHQPVARLNTSSWLQQIIRFITKS